MPPYRRPRRGRRRCNGSPNLWTILSVSLLLLSIYSTIATCEAINIKTPINRKSLIDQLAKRGEISVDRRAPPIPRSDVARRQQEVGSSSDNRASSSSLSPSSRSPSSATALTSGGIVIASSTASPPPVSGTGTPTSIVVAPTSLSDSPRPSPFDTSIGTNFTSQSCPDFFDDFLNNATFQSCLPLSLLLQNSNSFFKASRSPVLLTQTLETTCSVDFSTCRTVMSDLASQITTDDACGQDYRNENQVVLQARAGLEAYEPVFRAGCLKNQDTGNFCFADAVTDTTNPADSYPYYLALGISLPAASRPTCDQCLQDTMRIFSSAAADKAQPLSETYLPAAQQINLGCGPTFVNTTVNVATQGSFAARVTSPVTSVAVLIPALACGVLSTWILFA